MNKKQTSTFVEFITLLVLTSIYIQASAAPHHQIGTYPGSTANYWKPAKYVGLYNPQYYTGGTKPSWTNFLRKIRQGPCQQFATATNGCNSRYNIAVADKSSKKVYYCNCAPTTLSKENSICFLNPYSASRKGYNNVACTRNLFSF